jgi:hypothetical protein
VNRDPQTNGGLTMGTTGNDRPHNVALGRTVGTMQPSKAGGAPEGSSRTGRAAWTQENDA